MKERAYMCNVCIEAGMWSERKRATFAAINRAGIPLVLFGKSPVIHPGFLEQITVPVEYICDNDPEKWGTMQWERKVIRPDRLPSLYSSYNVLILVPFEAQIVPQLMKLSVPPKEVFRLDLYFEEPETAAYYQGVQMDLEKIYDGLADQESKDAYEAVIRYRIDRNPATLAAVALPRETQYFPDSLGGKPFLGTEEVFIDAGAFIGDTVEAFCLASRGRYRAIHAIEPELKNYERLLENTRRFPNVFCYRSAVGDCTGTISFSADGSNSRAEVSGAEAIPVHSLDKLLGGVPVTYLKMDVEGMECAALRGAKALIQTFHPKLAICIYHSNADVVQIPQIIWELDSSYKLYIRHYTNALVETVCYAL